MINFRTHFAIKVISIILVTTFLTLDIAWAHPNDGTPRQPAASTLALPYASQVNPVNAYAEKLQQSILAERGILFAIHDIAEYFLGDKTHDIDPLSIKNLEGALYENLKKYNDAYDIDLSIVSFNDGVITVFLTSKDGKKHRIHIAAKDNLEIRELAGYEWVISDRYAVKVRPANYSEKVHSPQSTVHSPTAEIASAMREKHLTYVMIKPDGIKERETILEMLRAAGIEIVYKGPARRLTTKEAKDLYAEHENKRFFPLLVDCITGTGPVIPLIVRTSDKDAVRAVRNVIGPLKGVDDHGNILRETIRGYLMTDADRMNQPITNLIHASDSIESAAREASVIIGEEKLREIVLPDSSLRGPRAEREGRSNLAISEPITIIEAPAAKAAEPPQTPKRMLTIRAIITSALVAIVATLFVSCSAFAGETVSMATGMPFMQYVEGSIILTALIASAACLCLIIKDLRKTGDVSKEGASDIDSLVNGLRSEDWHVQFDAVIDLDHIFSSSVVEKLISNAKYGDPDARAALDRMGIPKAVSALVQALDPGRHSYVRDSAVSALALIREPMLLAKALKDEDKNIRIRAASEISWMRVREPRIIASLALILAEKDIHAREVAAEALKYQGVASIPFLVEASKSEDLELSQLAVRILNDVRIMYGVNAAVKSLGSQDPKRQIAAAERLGAARVNDPLAINALSAAMADDDLVVRAAAKNALEIIKNDNDAKAEEGGSGLFGSVTSRFFVPFTLAALLASASALAQESSIAFAKDKANFEFYQWIWGVVSAHWLAVSMAVTIVAMGYTLKKLITSKREMASLEEEIRQLDESTAAAQKNRAKLQNEHQRLEALMRLLEGLGATLKEKEGLGAAELFGMAKEMIPGSLAELRSAFNEAGELLPYIIWKSGQAAVIADELGKTHGLLGPEKKFLQNSLTTFELESMIAKELPAVDSPFDGLTGMIIAGALALFASASAFADKGASEITNLAAGSMPLDIAVGGILFLLFIRGVFEIWSGRYREAKMVKLFALEKDFHSTFPEEVGWHEVGSETVERGSRAEELYRLRYERRDPVLAKALGTYGTVDEENEPSSKVRVPFSKNIRLFETPLLSVLAACAYFGMRYNIYGTFSPVIAMVVIAIAASILLMHGHKTIGSQRLKKDQADAALDELEATRLSIMRALRRSEDLSPLELYRLVESHIPDNPEMDNISIAFQVLRPLAGKKELSANDIDSVVVAAGEAYNLLAEEAALLCLALLGPGQGVGNEIARQAGNPLPTAPIAEITKYIKDNIGSISPQGIEPYLAAIATHLKSLPLGLTDAVIKGAIDGIRADCGKTGKEARTARFLKWEFADIVDEHDNVLCQTEIGFAHILGLRHRTANAYVVTPDGKVLLQRRAPGGRKYELFLSIFGGHVKAGETYKDAIRHALVEELGLKGDLKGETIPIAFERYSEANVPQNKENRELFAYFLTRDEYREVRKIIAGLEREKKKRTRNVFTKWICEKQTEHPGKYEVWGYYELPLGAIASCDVEKKVFVADDNMTADLHYIDLADKFYGETSEERAYFTPDLLERVVGNPYTFGATLFAITDQTRSMKDVRKALAELTARFPNGELSLTEMDNAFNEIISAYNFAPDAARLMRILFFHKVVFDRAHREECVIEMTKDRRLIFHRRGSVIDDKSDVFIQIEGFFDIQARANIGFLTPLSADGNPVKKGFVMVNERIDQVDSIGPIGVVDYAVFYRNGTARMYSGIVPQSELDNKDVVAIAVQNSERASRPGSPTVDRKTGTEPSLQYSRPYFIKDNLATECWAEWKGPSGAYWWVLPNISPIWPNWTEGAPQDFAQPYHIAFSRGRENADQTTMSERGSLLDTLTFFHQLNSSPSLRGKRAFRMGINGWYYSDASTAQKGGASQIQAHTHLVRFVYPIERAETKLVGVVDDIKVSVLGDREWGSGIVLEAPDTLLSIEAVAELAHEIIVGIAGKGDSFNILVTSDNGTIRVFIADRVLEIPAPHFTNAWAMAEFGRAAVIDAPSAFFQLSSEQEKDHSKAVNEEIRTKQSGLVKAWFKGERRRGALRYVDLGIFDRIRAALQITTAPKHQVYELARAIIAEHSTKREILAKPSADDALAHTAPAAIAIADTVTAEFERQEAARDLASKDEARTSPLVASAVVRTAEDSAPQVNNARAAMVRQANDILRSGLLPGLEGAAPIDPHRPAAEVKDRIERIIEIASSLTSFAPRNDEGVAHAVSNDEIGMLRKGLERLDADTIVDKVIALARDVKREGPALKDDNRKLFVGIGTNWIPGYESGNLQHNLLNPYLNHIKSEIESKLSGSGLNVEIVIGDDDAVAGTLIKRAGETGTDLSHVVAIAAQESVESSKAFIPLKSTETQRRACLLAIDPYELFEAYKQYDESMDKQIDANVMEALAIALDFAVSEEIPDVPTVDSGKSSKVFRILVWAPRAEKHKYDDLKKMNESREAALAAA